METLGNIIMPKLCLKFYCIFCDYGTNKKSSFANHLFSSKHLFSADGTKKETFGNAFMPELCFVEKISCEKCKKYFKSSSGLWKHNKKCMVQQINSSSIEEKAKNITDKDDLIMFLIKENSEFKNIILEQQNRMMKVIENGICNNTNTINNSTNNSHNKTFNLQVFLNETCKDAMNITDFVNSIKIQLSDLEKFGEVGYVEGISKIITTNLKALDITQRPVHCTDKKRETMYVKDEDKWEKEDDNKTKLRKAIKIVSNKNIKVLPQFREKYPEYSNSSSKISDKYDKMVIEVMVSDNDKDNNIIKNISNVTTIDKITK
jgi:hypothetical protein